MYQSIADEQAKACMLDLIRKRNSDQQYQEKLAIEDCVRVCFREFVEPFYSGKQLVRIGYNIGKCNKDNIELPSVLEVTMQALKNVGFMIENVEIVWYPESQGYVIEFDVVFNALNKKLM